MATRSVVLDSGSQGRFWAIRGLDDEGSSDDEAAVDGVPPAPTIGDALLQAKDLRGSRRKRKDKQARYVTLEERLKRCRELLQPAPPASPAPAPAVSPPVFRSEAAELSGSIPILFLYHGRGDGMCGE
jgi:hypothetical protein